MFSRHIDKYDYKNLFIILKGEKISLVVSAFITKLTFITKGNFRLNEKNNISKKVNKLLFFLFFPIIIFATDIKQKELVSFTAQKYRIDYNAQSQENKDKLKKDYEDTIKISNQISNEVKDDEDLKIAKALLDMNVWTHWYLKNLNISEQTLKELYVKEKPKTVPTYNLYNILVSDKKKADDIFASIEKLPKEKRLEEFKKQVKLNSSDFISNKKEGSMGWIEIQQLDKDTQEKIKDKKINDLVLSNVENIGYQIILIDDFKPIRDVSFEESKEFLTNLAKQQELIKKINSLLK